MYNSADDMKAYKDAMNSMADDYPLLISNYDEAGNAIIDLAAAEEELSRLRAEAAQSTTNAAIAERNKLKLEISGLAYDLGGLLTRTGEGSYSHLADDGFRTDSNGIPVIIKRNGEDIDLREYIEEVTGSTWKWDAENRQFSGINHLGQAWAYSIDNDTEMATLIEELVNYGGISGEAVAVLRAAQYLSRHHGTQGYDSLSGDYERAFEKYAAYLEGATSIQDLAGVSADAEVTD